eukprot:gb/GECG01007811.1/.p1 GENE.gb/GECG01007811.1/~~gb/GECG01007811.1/.p1  ORF type:complete len:201 (+),score=25.22 gb/GECG01007811.1/:1-603(+)
MSSSITPDNTLLIVCDVQEKFEKAIHGFGGLVDSASFLIRAAHLLGMHICATEQVPDKLGNTVSQLKEAWSASELASRVHVVSKTRFAVPYSVVSEVPKHIRNVILVGLETHVCILQTALQFTANEVNVYIPVDGVSSIRKFDRNIALKRLENTAGVRLTTIESVVFELVEDSQHECFRDISKLVKEQAAKTMENPLADA